VATEIELFIIQNQLVMSLLPLLPLLPPKKGDI